MDERIEGGKDSGGGKSGGGGKGGGGTKGAKESRGRNAIPAALFAAAVATTTLTACSVAPETVVRAQHMDENSFLATDARVRMITNSGIGPFSRPGQIDPNRVVCTEPSPDVATVIANSFGAGLSILGQGAGTFTTQQAEGMMSLVERTASIQLLRDKMYQTCLAYSNGAISGTSYAMIMSRLDETILSFLLGETAGGAFGRTGGALGTEASSEAQATLMGIPGGLQDVVKLGDELKVAQAEYDTAKADYDKAAASTPQSGASVPSDKIAARDASKLAMDEKQKRRDDVLKSIQSRADALAKSSGSVKSVIAMGGLTRSTSAEIGQTLRQMQEEFLSSDISRDVVSACMVEMASQAELRSPEQIRLSLAVAKQQAFEARLNRSERMLAQATEGAPVPAHDKLAIQGALADDITSIKDAQKKHADELNAAAAAVRQSGESRDLASEYHSKIFEALKSGLEDKKNFDYFLPNLASLAARERTTALAKFCYDKLDGVVAKAQENGTTYRRERLAGRVKADQAQAEAAKARAEADAARARSDGVATCAKIADAAQQKDCMAALGTPAK